MYPREMETGSKERDRGGEGKSLAYEGGSVRGERFCIIINRIICIHMHRKCTPDDYEEAFI